MCAKFYILGTHLCNLTKGNSFYDPDTNRRSDGRLHAHDTGEKLGDSRLQITDNCEFACIKKIHVTHN